MKVLVTRFAPNDDKETVAECWLRGEPSELRSEQTLRLSLRAGLRGRPSLHVPARLRFFVLAGFVDGKAAEFVGDFEQVLVAFVPLGADFAEKH
jgi:hypothetical protein